MAGSLFGLVLSLTGCVPSAEEATLDAHAGEIYSLAFHAADSHILASGGSDGRVIVWDVRERAPQRMLLPHAGASRLGRTSREAHPQVRWVGFSSDGTRLVALTRNIAVWETTGFGMVEFIESVDAQAEPPRVGRHVAAALSSDGRLLAVTTESGIDLWNLSDARKVAALPMRSVGRAMTFLEFAEDPPCLVACRAGRFDVWAVPGGELLQELSGHQNGTEDAAINGGDLYSIGGDGIVRSRSLSSGRQRWEATLECRADELPRDREPQFRYSLDVSPDGKEIAVCCGWEVAVFDRAGHPLRRFPVWGKLAWMIRRNPVIDIRFVGPAGTELVAIAWGAAMSQTVSLWSAHSGELIRQLGDHADFIRSLDVSADRRILATGAGKAKYWSNTIKLWRFADTDKAGLP